MSFKVFCRRFSICLLLLAGTVSCSSLQAAFHILKTDLNGEEMIKQEAEVKKTLQKMLENPQNWSISAYSRRAIAPHIKKSKLRLHSFYVIKEAALDGGGGGIFYRTLSFSGTAKKFYSEGAWTLDTNSDLDSYKKYLAGSNEWEVIEIKTKKGINTKRTIENIIRKIDGATQYYYKAHIKNKAGKDNCNSAIYTTLSENE